MTCFTINKVNFCAGTNFYYLASLFNHLNFNSMQTGTIKFFNSSKGFGFIVPDNGSQDIFVHATGTKEDLREHDKVEYEVQDGKKGPNAVNVRIIN